MAVSRKPKRDKTPARPQDAGEADILKVIERGGSVAGEVSSSSNEVKSFTLRVNGSVLGQVDAAVARHPVIKSRNTWIVNALVEQLKREGLS